MKLQYITDHLGKTIGVFIPIEEWNKLLIKYESLDQEFVEIPLAQQKEVMKRLEAYQNDPNIGLDFDQAMEEIEKELN